MLGSLLSLPRAPLVTAPTPLHLAHRLSDAIGVEVWFKRDDLTGLGSGGNKVRGLEYLIGEARAQGCQALVTSGDQQSNWARLASAAARRFGLTPYLVCRSNGSHRVSTGPRRRCGATPRLVCHGSPGLAAGEPRPTPGPGTGATSGPGRSSVDSAMSNLALELTTLGRHPYVVPDGGATGRGALGQVRASLELAQQLMTHDLAPATLWLATGSGATQAGLVAGARWLGSPYQVTGVTVDRPAGECATRVRTLAAAVADLLDLPPVDTEVTVMDGYRGPGYGRASPEGRHAMRLVALTEGVSLDPVFGAKAMAALINAASDHRVEDPVIFLVAGSAPILTAEDGR